MGRNERDQALASTYVQILEETPFSIQYYPFDPFQPIAEWQLQEAEHALGINAIYYYEWAIQVGKCDGTCARTRCSCRFFYPLEIAECIVSYWETRWQFARYKLKPWSEL